MERQNRAAVLSVTLQLTLRAYQLLVSPLLPPSCRFFPSCSQYAIEAIGRHGPVRGAALALHRLMRCHPWGDSGYDPVPPPPGFARVRHGLRCEPAMTDPSD